MTSRSKLYIPSCSHSHDSPIIRLIDLDKPILRYRLEQADSLQFKFSILPLPKSFYEKSSFSRQEMAERTLAEEIMGEFYGRYELCYNWPDLFFPGTLTSPRGFCIETTTSMLAQLGSPLEDEDFVIFDDAHMSVRYGDCMRFRNLPSICSNMVSTYRRSCAKASRVGHMTHCTIHLDKTDPAYSETREYLSGACRLGPKVRTDNISIGCDLLFYRHGELSQVRHIPEDEFSEFSQGLAVDEKHRLLSCSDLECSRYIKECSKKLLFDDSGVNTSTHIQVFPKPSKTDFIRLRARPALMKQVEVIETGKVRSKWVVIVDSETVGDLVCHERYLVSDWYCVSKTKFDILKPFVGCLIRSDFFYIAKEALGIESVKEAINDVKVLELLILGLRYAQEGDESPIASVVNSHEHNSILETCFSKIMPCDHIQNVGTGSTYYRPSHELCDVCCFHGRSFKLLSLLPPLFIYWHPSRRLEWLQANGTDLKDTVSELKRLHLRRLSKWCLDASAAVLGWVCQYCA